MTQATRPPKRVRRNSTPGPEDRWIELLASLCRELLPPRLSPHGPPFPQALGEVQALASQTLLRMAFLHAASSRGLCDVDIPPSLLDVDGPVPCERDVLGDAAHAKARTDGKTPSNWFDAAWTEVERQLGGSVLQLPARAEWSAGAGAESPVSLGCDRLAPGQIANQHRTRHDSLPAFSPATARAIWSALSNHARELDLGPDIGVLTRAPETSLATVYEALLPWRLEIRESAPASTGSEVTIASDGSLPKPGRAARSDRERPSRLVGNFAGLGAVHLVRASGPRKLAGAFYTPAPLARWVVRRALDHVVSDTLSAWALQLHDAETCDAPFEPRCRILDPAAGAGRFVVAALHELETLISDWRARLTAELCRRFDDWASAVTRGSPVSPPATGRENIRRLIAERCLYACDLDPAAVGVARADLWLAVGCRDLSISRLEHLRCGDGLNLDWNACRAVLHQPGFDVVMGNPPHVGHKAQFNQATHGSIASGAGTANLAAAFLARALDALRPGGEFALIVPKALQYVERWRDTRELVAGQNRLLEIVDLSEAFPGVLLEQCLCRGARLPSAETYTGSVLDRSGRACGVEVATQWRTELGCLPVHVSERAGRLLGRLIRLGPRLAEISDTFQALGYQSRLNRGVSGELWPISRGKQIRPLFIEPATDRIDRSFLVDPRTNELTAKCRALLSPKVMTQNIIAHVRRPRPRLWIMSAADHEGRLCLNTVSATLVHDARFPIDYIATILNSSLAAWFFSEFIFCRAVRTMHFDGEYAGRLPVPVPNRELIARCAALPHEVRGTPPPERQRQIDAVVFDAYGLDEPERRIVLGASAD